MNLAIGGAIQTFEVSTLGQPFEVIKTHMAGKVVFSSREVFMELMPKFQQTVVMA